MDCLARVRAGDSRRHSGSLAILAFLLLPVHRRLSLLPLLLFLLAQNKSRQSLVSPNGIPAQGAKRLTSCQPHTGLKLSKKPTSSNRFG